MTIPIRRVVLRHTAGPYVGLRQIMGVIEATDLPLTLPAFEVWPDDRSAGARMVRTSPRWVEYVEEAIAC